MTTVNEKIRKIGEFLRACEWDANASRLQNVLNFRLTRIRDCSFYIDSEAKIVEIWIQYKELDDEGFYIEENHYLFPKKEVDIMKLSLAGLERRCQHRSSWTAPEFFEVIRRAGLSAKGTTPDEYMETLWAAGRSLDVQMSRREYIVGRRFNLQRDISL